MRQLLKELGFGKLAYQYFYKPILAPATFEGSRGLIEIPSKIYAENELKRRIFQLSPPNFSPIDLPLVFLTGTKFYHQTLLCALSLIYAIEQMPSITIYDDGTLNQKQCDLLQHLLPNASIFRRSYCDEIVHEQLPSSHYKNLHFLRDKSVLMYKLIDANIITPSQIYLDSDMIFWQNPTEMIQLYHAKTPFYMYESYCYKDSGLICEAELIAEAIGLRPVNSFNTGMIYQGSEEVDWDFIDKITGQLLQLPIQRFHFFEQTLQAVLFAKISKALSLSTSYHVAYARLPATLTTVTHYIGSMKIPYMNREWSRWFLTCKPSI